MGRRGRGNARAVRDNRRGMTVVAIVFWVAAGLLVYTQVGLRAAAGAAGAPTSRRARPAAAAGRGELPQVTAIVAAYNEQERDRRQRIANLRSLDYPAERLR